MDHPIPELIDTNFQGIPADDYPVPYTLRRDLKINSIIKCLREQQEAIRNLQQTIDRLEAKLLTPPSAEGEEHE